MLLVPTLHGEIDRKPLTKVLPARSAEAGGQERELVGVRWEVVVLDRQVGAGRIPGLTTRPHNSRCGSARAG